MSKLQAATRLKADALSNFIDSLDPGQVAYLVSDLLVDIHGWFDGDFLNDHPSDNPDVVIARGQYRPLDRLIVALSHIRPFFPPKSYAKVSRVQNVKELPHQTTVEFKTTQKPLTSWSSSTRPDTLVIEWAEAWGDKSLPAIIMTSKPKANQILADFDSLSKLLATLHKYWPQLEQKLAGSPWQKNIRQYKQRLTKNSASLIASWKDEKEVLVYLKQGQSLDCTWVPVADWPGNTKQAKKPDTPVAPTAPVSGWKLGSVYQMAKPPYSFTFIPFRVDGGQQVQCLRLSAMITDDDDWNMQTLDNHMFWMPIDTPAKLSYSTLEERATKAIAKARSRYAGGYRSSNRLETQR